MSNRAREAIASARSPPSSPWWREGRGKAKRCKEWGLPEPEFEIKSNNIVVIFRKSKLTEEYLDGLGLSTREKEIIQILKEKRKITSSDIQRRYGVSRDTANRWLNKLIRSNLIERQGKGKAVYYVLREM